MPRWNCGCHQLCTTRKVGVRKPQDRVLHAYLVEGHQLSFNPNLCFVDAPVGQGRPGFGVLFDCLEELVNRMAHTDRRQLAVSVSYRPNPAKL